MGTIARMHDDMHAYAGIVNESKSVHEAIFVGLVVDQTRIFARMLFLCTRHLKGYLLCLSYVIIAPCML